MRKRSSVMLIAVLALFICLTMAFSITAYADGEGPADSVEKSAECVVDKDVNETSGSPLTDKALEEELNAPASDEMSEEVRQNQQQLGQEPDEEAEIDEEIDEEKSSGLI